MGRRYMRELLRLVLSRTIRGEGDVGQLRRAAGVEHLHDVFVFHVLRAAQDDRLVGINLLDLAELLLQLIEGKRGPLQLDRAVRAAG